MTKPYKKPKVLKRKNVKRRTGAKAQSTQILALTKSLSSLTKENYENIRTSWRMLRKNIGGTFSTIPTAYVCPLPYAVCDPLGTGPTTGPRFFADNNMNGPQTQYNKRLVFGYSNQAVNASKIYHTGGRLRYQIETNEPSYSRLTLAVIKPKKKEADQLTEDRNLKNFAAASYAGSAANLQTDLDFTSFAPPAPAGVPTTNETTFGAEINTKYWSVVSRREIALCHPNATSIEQTAKSGNTNPLNNSLVATGTIRLPAGGVIENTEISTTTIDDKSSPAMEVNLIDQRNENSCYLVIIHNDGTADGQSIKLSAICTDYYKAVV